MPKQAVIMQAVIIVDTCGPQCPHCKSFHAYVSTKEDDPSYRRVTCKKISKNIEIGFTWNEQFPDICPLSEAPMDSPYDIISRFISGEKQGEE